MDYLKHHHPAGILQPGTPAPDFTLQSAPGATKTLSEFRGQPVILAFYPADWSPVCGDQMALYNEILDEFQEHGAELLGISLDGAWCHKAYAEAKRLRFPLLSDFEPKGAVSRAYGAYAGDKGQSARALFVIDREGIIRWSHLSPRGVNPGADGILRALEALSKPVSAHSAETVPKNPPAARAEPGVPSTTRDERVTSSSRDARP